MDKAYFPFSRIWKTSLPKSRLFSLTSQKNSKKRRFCRVARAFGGEAPVGVEPTIADDRIWGGYQGILAATLRQRHGSALRRAANLRCQRWAGRKLSHGSRRKNLEIVDLQR